KLFDLGRDLLVKLVHLGLPLFGRLASLDLAHSGAPSLVSGETSPGGLVVAPPPRFLPLKAALLLAPRRRPHQPEGRRRRKVLPRIEGACDRAAEVSGGAGPGAVAEGLVRAERGAMIRRPARQHRGASPARGTRAGDPQQSHGEAVRPLALRQQRSGARGRAALGVGRLLDAAGPPHWGSSGRVRPSAVG